MPVKLEWEIDDVDVPLPDAGSQAEGRRRGCRRWLRFAVFVAVVVAAGVGLVRWRIHQKQDEVENELRAVVKLELNALNKGDQDLFLNQQKPGERDWQTAQKKEFERYRQRVDRAEWSDVPVARYSGEISNVQIKGDQGWALVEVVRDERAWQELWYYDWTREDGWRHLPLPQEWLGEPQALTTLHLHFTYLERDKEIVHALAREMEAWYDTLALLLGVRSAGDLLLSVDFSYRNPVHVDVSEIEWDKDQSRTLLAPSPHQDYLSINGTVGADGLPTLELRQQMISHLVEAMIAQRAGLHPEAELPVEMSALRYELHDWAITRALPSERPEEKEAWTILPTPLVDALVTRDGVGVVSLLAARLDGAQSLDQLLAAAGLAPPDPAARFAFLLAAENRALYYLDGSLHVGLADPDADNEWYIYYNDQWRWWFEGEDLGLTQNTPLPGQVRSVVFNGDVAWVESETTSPEGNIYRQAHFFRQIDSAWRLTSPDPAYFGERRTTRTENLILHYFERDAQWYQGNYLEELQDIFNQIADDLDLSTAGLTLTVKIEMLPNSFGRDELNTLKLTSPSVNGWPLNRQSDYFLQQNAYFLIDALTQLKIGTLDSQLYGPHLFTVPYAVTLWELARLFPEYAERIRQPAADADRMLALPLAELWPDPTIEPVETDWMLRQTVHHALVAYLAETYGPEVIPKLLENLSQTDDPDEWLRLSTGEGIAEIEPRWRAWVLATYVEP